MFVFCPRIRSVIPILCQQAPKSAFSTFYVDFSKWPSQTLRIYVCSGRPATVVSAIPTEQEMGTWLPTVLREVGLKFYAEGSVMGDGGREDLKVVRNRTTS